MNTSDILQTVRMITEEKLDIRTITMGISLYSCAHPDKKQLYQNVYDRITTQAKDLVKTGETLEREFGIPIVNKRISVTPASLVAAACGDPIVVARAMDAAAKETGVNYIGGYTALVQKGMTASDRALIASLPEALSTTERVCSSVNVASTRAGIDMDAVRLCGQAVKDIAAATADSDASGCMKLVVFANAEAKGQPFDVVAETIKRTAFKITRVGQLIAKEASARLNVPFGIVDLSLAPTPAMGDSVAHILEEMGLEVCGCHGTTAALALLNDAVKKGGVMASSHVGGLSGAFIPVSEDIGMINAAARGALSLEKLEAMTCVCSVGLDMIAVPGDTPASTIAAIIADEAAIGMVNSKTTAVRIIPAPGKKVGDEVEFGGLFGRAPIMRVSPYSAEEFIARGGRIPAPLQSLKN